MWETLTKTNLQAVLILCSVFLSMLLFIEAKYFLISLKYFSTFGQTFFRKMFLQVITISIYLASFHLSETINLPLN